MVDPIFLPDVESQSRSGPAGERIRQMEAAGLPVPPIWRLLGYRPEATNHLNHYTQAVLRGPSLLPPGIRELIAAFTSTENQCVF